MTRPPIRRDGDAPARRRALRSGRRDDRGVSFTVSYVLSLSIAVLLVSGVILATGEVVRDQRASAIRSEATVVGDEVAASVMAADRLARLGDDSAVAMTVRLPERLADTPYTVSLDVDGSAKAVVVRTESPSIAVRVPLTSETPVDETTVAGGDVRIAYESDGGGSSSITLRGEP